MSVLDNAFWESLNGPHRAFSSGDGRARRYARGFPAIAGFPDPQRPDFEALGARTRVDWRVRFKPWVPGTGGLLAHLLRRQMERVLARLAAQPFSAG